MQTTDMVYTACWGGATCLFLQYMLQAFIVFEKKDSIIFQLILVGLIMCYLQSSLTMIVVVLDVTRPEVQLSVFTWYCISIPMNLAWFAMVQINQWLYVLRIRSLGCHSKFESYIIYVPYSVALLQLPNFIINVARLNIKKVDFGKYSNFITSSSIFSICISFVEICMFIILLQKLNFILEYKPEVLLKMAYHLTLTCSFVVCLEIIMAAVRFFILVDFSISPLINLLKLYIIIQFYNDLIISINKQVRLSLSKESLKSVDPLLEANT